MSEANDTKTTVPVPKEGLAAPAPSNVTDDAPPADAVVDTSVLANFTPLPSALGVTYSMI